jgi:hypothetical protein
MHIFVDESGSFVRPATGRNLSCVGALVVPDGRLIVLERKFKRLVAGWNFPNGEVKGSALDESQIASVISLLRNAGCYFFVGGTEMSVNEPAAMQALQAEQTRLLTADLTPAHSEAVRQQAADLQARYQRMPLQLFLQSVVLTSVVKRVIDLASLRFALVGPARELGAYHWVIDAKSPEAQTANEEAWQLLAAPFLHYQSLVSAGVRAVEGDYSHFDRNFSIFVDDERQSPRPRAGFNLNKILYDSMRFAESAATPGLQLADIVTNAFRRALMGRLRPAGYYHLGELMLRHNGRTVEFLRIGPRSGDSPQVPEYEDPYHLIVRHARSPDVR